MDQLRECNNDYDRNCDPNTAHICHHSNITYNWWTICAQVLPIILALLMCCGCHSNLIRPKPRHEAETVSDYYHARESKLDDYWSKLWKANKKPEPEGRDVCRVSLKRNETNQTEQRNARKNRMNERTHATKQNEKQTSKLWEANKKPEPDTTPEGQERE
jgi:hypothetical protein